MVRSHGHHCYLLVIFSVFVASLSLVPEADDIRSKLDSMIEDFMSCRDIPGLTLSIVYKGNVFISKGYGKADVEKDVNVTANGTLFCVASLTKAFTATLVEKLIPGATGRDSKPLALLLKNVTRANGCCKFSDEYMTKHVTMVDLLSHRTGIGRYDFMWIRGDTSRGEIIKRIRHMQQVHDFRDQPLYTNVMFTLAGHVLEQLQGQPWEVLLRKHLLQPLGMSSSTFIGHRRRPGTQFASQYENMGGKRYKISMNLHNGSATIGPAISLCTTADDMTKWMTFQLSGGKTGEGQQILPPSAIDNVHEPVVVGNLYDFHLRRPLFPARLFYDRYAKGWFLGNYEDQELLMHYGSYPGFYSMITLAKELDLGIFASMHGARDTTSFNYLNLLHIYILDLFLGNEPWLNGSSICSFPAPWSPPPDARTAKSHSTKRTMPLVHPAQTYVGLYAHPVLGDLIIRKAGNALRMRFGRIVSDLFPVSATEFQVVPIVSEWMIGPGKAEFTFNSDNSSANLVRVPYYERRISPVFVKNGANKVTLPLELIIFLAIASFYISNRIKCL